MRILLCTDMDGTIIPNSPAEESPGARNYFRQLADHEDITLVYVTGRHLELMEEAISDYALPRPDVALVDVGSRIFAHEGEGWSHLDEWYQAIAPAWNGLVADDLAGIIGRHRGLHRQEAERQHDLKLSYYYDADVKPVELRAQIQARLHQNGVLANLIFSYDELAERGLLDILPPAPISSTPYVF